MERQFNNLFFTKKFHFFQGGKDGFIPSFIERNHEQIKEMATQNDVMIIICSFTSANSKRLTELSMQRNKNSYQVTCAEDLDVKWFRDDVKSIGISAGASTPDYLIEEVEKKRVGQKGYKRQSCQGKLQIQLKL